MRLIVNNKMSYKNLMSEAKRAKAKILKNYVINYQLNASYLNTNS